MTTSDRIASLTGISSFGPLPSEMMAPVAGSATLRPYEAGAAIRTKGAVLREILVPVTGDLEGEDGEPLEAARGESRAAHADKGRE